MEVAAAAAAVMSVLGRPNYCGYQEFTGVLSGIFQEKPASLSGFRRKDPEPQASLGTSVILTSRTFGETLKV